MNIWSADPMPAAVTAVRSGLVARNTVLSGTVESREELDEVLRLLRRLGVRVVSLEVEP